MKRIISLILFVMLCLLFVGCETENLATDVIFEQETYEITVDDTIKINYVLLPDGASNKELLWKSMDESIVTVDNGTVTAKRIGNTNIVVSRDDVFVKTIKVVVKQKRALDLMSDEEKDFFFAFRSNLSRFKDPDSVEITNIEDAEDGEAWYITISAKNGFGGTSTEQYTLTKQGTLSSSMYLHGFSKPSSISESLINRAIEEW